MSNPANVIAPPTDKQSPVMLGGRLEGISLTKQIVILSAWPFLQNLMGTMVSFADRVIAGQTMSAETQTAVFDAMGLAMYVSWLMMIMLGAVSTGAQALVARAFGARDDDLAERATAQSFVLGVVSGALSGLLVWAATPGLISVFGLSGDAALYASQYLKIVALSAPLSGVLFVCNACLRAGGDTKTPFVAMAAVNVVNVVLSVVFMNYLLPPEEIGFGGQPHGVAGLAWGTVASWIVGSTLIVRAMLPRRRNKTVVVLKRSLMAWNWPVGKRILRVGLPQLVEILGMWLIHAFGVWMITNKLQQEGVLGAHGMVIQIESISFMPGFALGMAASTLAGQYLGAKSKEMAAKAVRVCWYVAMALMGTIGVCIVFFAPQLVSIMSPTGGEQAEMAVEIIRVVGWTQPFFATAMVMKMSMRGAGATGLVMLTSFSMMLLIRVGVLTACFYYYADQMTLFKVWMIMALDLIVQASVFTVLHFRGRWLDAEV